MNDSNSIVLLVEDSEEDFRAMKRVITKNACNFDLRRCETAEDALDFLHRRGQYINLPADFSSPVLILLDLNLPGMDGRDLLLEIKKDQAFRKIPVVALTTSNNPRDIADCYDSGVNSYQIKPVNFEKFSEEMGKLFAYWLEAATLPSSIK